MGPTNLSIKGSGPQIKPAGPWSPVTVLHLVLSLYITVPTRLHDVGIASGYGLDDLGTKFSAPLHTGPGAPPASCTTVAGFPSRL